MAKPRPAEVPDWKPVTRERMRAIRDRLREMYGRPVNEPHRDPIHELVLTILSQNTNDRNRDVAYGRLRESFGSWEEIIAADVTDVEAAIAPGGLAASKAPRIQQALTVLSEDPEHGLDLSWIETAPREVTIPYLEALPGVGRKTAACILLFTYDLPEVPVDTHVYRIGIRLGLFPPNASFEFAHDEMVRLVDPEDSFEVHMNLIHHGRALCKTRPKCSECNLRRMCPWARHEAGSS